MPHFRQDGRTGPSQALLDEWADAGFVPNLLWLAAAGEQPAVVQRLLTLPHRTTVLPEGLDQPDPDQGWTPLMMLLQQTPYHAGRREVRPRRSLPLQTDDLQQAAMALLDAGADPYLEDARGLSATAYAMQQAAGAWLAHLVRHPRFDLARAVDLRLSPDELWDPRTGTGRPSTDGQRPDLLSYALLHQQSGVDELLRAGWSANRPNGRGMPPLHLARCVDHLAVLLEHGADPLALDHQGESAVAHYTRAVDDTDARNAMIRRLQDAQQDLVRSDPDQARRWRQAEFPTLFDAIGNATKDTFVKLFRTLVTSSEGALTVNTPDARGRTLLEEAWRQDKPAIVGFLLDQGSDPLMAGSHGLPVWTGLLANGPAPTTAQHTPQAQATARKEADRRAAAWTQITGWPGFDANARRPDGRSLLLAMVADFERLTPAYPRALFREQEGKLPKALWWAVHQLLAAGADPHVQDAVAAFPMMDGEQTSGARDLRWPVALAVKVIPTHGPQEIPDHHQMGMASQHEVQALLIRATNRQPGARQFPTVLPVPIASAWFATLVGAYVQDPNASSLSSYPLAMKPLEPFAEMPSGHPLVGNGRWQDMVIRKGGPFAMVLERQALLRAANEAGAEPSPVLPRRRL